MNSTDSIGNTTTYSYNTSNNLLSSVTSGSGTVSYQYDSNYKFLTAVSTPSANYQFTYDEFGNRTSTAVGNRTLASYVYNAGGAMTRMNYGNGNYVTYSYDNYGNVKAKALNGTQVYQGIADNSGTITKAIDKQNNLQYNYVYDSTDRLISSSVTDTGTNQSKAMYEYDFDLNNNLSKFTVLTPSGSNKTTYTYVEDNLPKTTTLQNDKIVTNDYDKLGRLTQSQLNTSNAITTNYYYTASNTSGYTTTLLEKEENGGLSFKYEYDANGNITRISRKNGSAYTASEEYTYDALGELTQVDYLDLNQRITYTYDNSGNILEEKIYTVNNGTATLSYTNTYTYGDNNWKDLLTEYNSDTFTYDTIGNPLAYRDGISFTWSNGRQLQSYSKGSTNISYTYDTNGMRLTKNVNGLQYSYLYQGGLLLQETRGTRVLDYSYDANGQPVCVKYKNNNNSNGTYYYYARNSRGDIIGLYNADGTLYCTYTYDVWGNILSVKDTNDHELTAATDIANLQSLKYRGYYYDYETGLYYLQSRYYDPITHRFVNADGSISTGTGILGYNMFAYCNNNPINYYDPSGNETMKEVQQAVGGIIPNNCGWTILDVTFAQKAGLSDSDQYYKVGTTTSGYPLYVMYVDRTLNFVPFTVWLFDDRNNSEDPNLRIINSHEYIEYSIMQEIVTEIYNYTTENPNTSEIPWDMSKYDLMKEWDAHNISYALHIKRESSKEVDFNMKEDRQWYFNLITHALGCEYYYIFF